MSFEGRRLASFVGHGGGRERTLRERKHFDSFARGGGFVNLLRAPFTPSGWLRCSNQSHKSPSARLSWNVVILKKQVNHFIIWSPP